MKTKKKVLIGLMALCLAGGIGSAFSLVINGASNVRVGSGSADEAIYLHFDDEHSSVAKLENLGVASQFRYVKVLAPSKSSGVTGNYTVTFTLAPTTDYTLAGVTCKIYQGLNATTYVSARQAEEQGKTASTPTNTLSGGDASVSQAYSISVANGEEFYLEFNYVKDTNNAKSLGGSLLVGLDRA